MIPLILIGSVLKICGKKRVWGVQRICIPYRSKAERPRVAITITITPPGRSFLIISLSKRYPNKLDAKMVSRKDNQKGRFKTMCKPTITNMGTITNSP